MRWMIVCACLFLSACSHHHSDYYLGYVEGKYIYLSSPVSGQLTTLLVRQGETVTENQPAFQLDPEPEQSQLAAAKAELNIATHDLDNNRCDDENRLTEINMRKQSSISC